MVALLGVTKAFGTELVLEKIGLSLSLDLVEWDSGSVIYKSKLPEKIVVPPATGSDGYEYWLVHAGKTKTLVIKTHHLKPNVAYSDEDLTQYRSELGADGVKPGSPGSRDEITCFLGHRCYKQIVEILQQNGSPCISSEIYVLYANGVRYVISATTLGPRRPSEGDSILKGALDSMHFIPIDKQPNQPPLQTPTSGTPAAGAPVAPPSGAAGR
jgi:hypothetical protein